MLPPHDGADAISFRGTSMANKSSLSTGSSRPEPSDILVERVRVRVTQARAAIEKSASSSDFTPEARSLRRVFTQMGNSYRQHRRRTGQNVLPAVREAALAFKKEPTMDSLVLVAAQLEGEGILAW